MGTMWIVVVVVQLVPMIIVLNVLLMVVLLIKQPQDRKPSLTTAEPTLPCATLVVRPAPMSTLSTVPNAFQDTF